MAKDQKSAAAEFRRLHHEGAPLVLANAWDAGTARLIESVGATAIATTSAGVAWTHGYPDGDKLPRQLLIATVEEIARVIKVPLTVDFEGGYAADLAGIEESVATVIGAGAVGVNIEDGKGSPDLLCGKIERAKRAASRLGIELFVNARTDVYLFALVPAERRVAETLARAERYRAAGADGIFVPAVIDSAEIRTIAAAVGLPLNVLARPNLPPLAELAKLGVRRLSAGSGITQAIYGRTAALAASFLRDGRSDVMTEGAKPHPEINALMSAI